MPALRREIRELSAYAGGPFRKLFRPQASSGSVTASASQSSSVPCAVSISASHSLVFRFRNPHIFHITHTSHHTELLLGCIFNTNVLCFYCIFDTNRDVYAASRPFFQKSILRSPCSHPDRRSRHRGDASSNGKTVPVRGFSASYSRLRSEFC